MWLRQKPCLGEWISQLGVRVAVMVAMMGRPPQRPALHAGGAKRSEQELHRPRCGEGLVRKVAVIEAGDGEHAKRIHRGGDDNRKPGRADPDHPQAGEVQADERDHSQPVDAIGPCIGFQLAGAGVEPAQKGQQRPRQAPGRSVQGLDFAWPNGRGKTVMAG